MENILLVEPDYDNKYPPIGLMKIASYYKNRGDYVEFYKGKAPYNTIQKMDRIYITSLFTFYFDETVETINYYLRYTNPDNVYIGGISVMLMPEKYMSSTGIKKENILLGQLISSNMLGYNDEINIDILPLDYDILDDVNYDYKISDNFFGYTTRGCPRKCDFCAVKTLETKFEETNHIVDQVQFVRDKYGDKRNLLLMDNNVIFSKNLDSICNDLNSLGFINNTATYIPPNQASLYYSKFARRKASGNSTWLITEKFINYLKKFVNRVKSEYDRELLNSLQLEGDLISNREQILIENQEAIIDIVEKYRCKKPLQRYVDFNQGLDARLLSDEKMEILSTIPIRPFRLAYDDLSSTDDYIRAFDLAYKHGVRHFSNYLLYNYRDEPKDLWMRLNTSIKLYSDHENVTAFSFPMKYAPVDRTDRHFVGTNWNVKFLSAMNIILNVTKGIVAKESDFFYRAYGKTTEEFLEILSMPNEFIKYRQFFDDCGLTQLWKREFESFSETERKEFVRCISEGSEYENKFKSLGAFYKITKRQVEKGTLSLPKKDDMN